MHPPVAVTLGLIILAASTFPRLGQAALADVFIVKAGTTEGGCDNINYDLNAMFNEASTIIDAAVDAFSDYSNDYTVRKLALSFFGIQMNDQLSGPKDQANTDALTNIQKGFQSLKDFASASRSLVSTTSFQKAWLFCDSNWVEAAAKTDEYLAFDNDGQLKPWVIATPSGWPLAKAIPASPNDLTPHATVGEMFERRSTEFANGHLNAYFSRDMGRYRLADPNPNNVINACAQKQEKASTSNHDGIVGISFCLRGNNIVKAATLDTSKGEGTWLHELEMNSLTFIHEFYHAGTNGGSSADVKAWSPDANTRPRNADGTVNDNWPGDPNTFVEEENIQAGRVFTIKSLLILGDADHHIDSVTDTLVLALVNGRRRADQTTVDVTNNPQNYAWAAIAAYLARNGAKLDYSTGVARPLDAQPAGPAPRPTPPSS